ncbi:chorismate synthase [Candidatus Gottesmanbacteria bacterium]|nr:chorismate synthase [Candidatus Gottesmanbacteria bacterium]
MLRFLTAGESHGPAEIAILEGLPAGLAIDKDVIQQELDKRRGGAGRGGRGAIEKDQVKILSGVRFGKTLGSPIALIVDNLDFANWAQKMQIEPFESIGADSFHPSGGTALHPPLTTPRPGHADLAGGLKYGFEDIRNVLERASARETIMRVAISAICKKFLLEFNIEIASHTIQIGQIKLSNKNVQFEDIKNVFNKNPEIRCIDPNISSSMKNEILAATKSKNTLGGVVEIIAHHVPVGLGSYVHYDRKIDGRISQSLMSIPSVKAVEIGEGITNASLYGSQVHDDIYYKSQGPTLKKYYRKTNKAGGIEGGVTNGEDIIIRVYHKPISTLGNPKDTVDIATKKPAKALIERSDICVVPRAGVISEAMLAFVLADEMLRKFGGDNIVETKRNFKGYIKALK